MLLLSSLMWILLMLFNCMLSTYFLTFPRCLFNHFEWGRCEIPHQFVMQYLYQVSQLILDLKKFLKLVVSEFAAAYWNETTIYYNMAGSRYDSETRRETNHQRIFWPGIGGFAGRYDSISPQFYLWSRMSNCSWSSRTRKLHEQIFTNYRSSFSQ